MVAEVVPLGISIIDSLSSIFSDKLRLKPAFGDGSIIYKSLTSSKLNSLKVEFTKSVNKSSFPFFRVDIEQINRSIYILLHVS